MRALAQSLSREFGPQGVHVNHAIIDGVIDIPRTRDWTFDKPDAKISADAVSNSSFLEERVFLIITRNSSWAQGIRFWPESYF